MRHERQGGHTDRGVLAKVEVRLHVHPLWDEQRVASDELVPGVIGGVSVSVDTDDDYPVDSSKAIREAITHLLHDLETLARKDDQPSE